MQELNMEESLEVSGCAFVPNVGALLVNVAVGAVTGLVFGGPGGMIGGAIAGAAAAAGGTMCNDAYLISEDRKLQAQLKK